MMGDAAGLAGKASFLPPGMYGSGAAPHQQQPGEVPQHYDDSRYYSMNGQSAGGIGIGLTDVPPGYQQQGQGQHAVDPSTMMFMQGPPGAPDTPGVPYETLAGPGQQQMPPQMPQMPQIPQQGGGGGGGGQQYGEMGWFC